MIAVFPGQARENEKVQGGISRADQGVGWRGSDAVDSRDCKATYFRSWYLSKQTHPSK